MHHQISWFVLFIFFLFITTLSSFYYQFKFCNRRYYQSVISVAILHIYIYIYIFEHEYSNNINNYNDNNDDIRDTIANL